MNAHAHGFAGDVLIRAGLVDAAGLARGLDAQTRQSTTLGRALAELGLADESAVAAAMASALHLEFLDADPPPEVPGAVAALLPAAFCQKRGVAPVSLIGNTLRVAVINPADYSVLQDVEFRTGKKAIAVVVTQTWFERFLKRRGTQEGSRAATCDMLDAAKPTGEVEAGAEEYDLDVVDARMVAKDVQLPPVIVSDVNMPGLGGVDMVKQLRAEPRTADMRILMLTSETSVESEEASLAAGADDHMAKPVEPRRLAARVKALRARRP